MSDLTFAMRLTGEAASALQAIQAVQTGVKQTGAEARTTAIATKEIGASLVDVGARGRGATDATTASMGRLRQAMQEIAATDPGAHIRASFDALRASVDPAFAASQRYRDIQISLAAMVATGEVRQSAANIVLEQAGSRYLGVATAAERLASAQATEAAASATSAASLQQLIAQFDPLHTNAMRYEEALTRITAALEAESISEAQAGRLRTNAAQQLLGVSVATANAGLKTEKLGLAAQFAAGGGLKGLLQQLSQVAQQGSVTGNFVGALSLQAADIGIAFGTVGIAVGAAISLLGPALTAALGAGTSAEKQMTDATDALSGSISALQSITADFADGDLTKLKEKYGEVDAALLQLIDHQREEQIIGAQNAAKEAISALAAEYGVASGALNFFEITGTGAAASIAKELGFTKNELLAFEQALKDAQNAKSFDEQAAALGRVDELLRRSTINGGDLANSVTEVVLRLRQTAKAAVDSDVALGRATSTMTSGLHNATSAANGFASALSAALGYANSIASSINGLDFDHIAKAAELAALQAGLDPAAAKNAGVTAKSTAQLRPLLNAPTGASDYARAEIQSQTDKLARDAADNAALAAWNKAHPVAGSSGSGGGASSDTLKSLQTEAKAAMTALDLAIGSINEKVKAGLLSTSDAAGAVKSAKETAAGAIADLLPKLDKFGAAGDTVADTWRTALGQLADQLKGVGTSVAALSTDMTENFRAPFATFLAGTKSAGNAWDDFLSGIGNAISTKLSNKFTNDLLGPLLDGIFGSLGGLKLFADGGLPGISDLSGLLLSSPTAFAMPGGGTGVAGEAGTEAVMPVKSGPSGYSVTGLLGGREVLLGLGRGQDGKLGVTLPAPRAFAMGGVPGSSRSVEAANGNDASPSASRPAARAGNTYITVNNTTAQATARAETRMQGDDHLITILVEAVGDALSENISNGSGSLPGSIEAVYGLARQGRG